MIIRINGRVISQPPTHELVPAELEELFLPEENIYSLCWRGKVLEQMDKVEDYLRNLLPRGSVLVGIPGGGLADKLWPLIDKLQEFGLVIGVTMALWGICRVMMGDPSGKTQIWQAIIGFVGLYVIPEVFLAIRDAFEGGA